MLKHRRLTVSGVPSYNASELLCHELYEQIPERLWNWISAFTVNNERRQHWLSTIEPDVKYPSLQQTFHQQTSLLSSQRISTMFQLSSKTKRDELVCQKSIKIDNTEELNKHNGVKNKVK